MASNAVQTVQAIPDAVSSFVSSTTGSFEYEADVLEEVDIQSSLTSGEIEVEEFYLDHSETILERIPKGAGTTINPVGDDGLEDGLMTFVFDDVDDDGNDDDDHGYDYDSKEQADCYVKEGADENITANIYTANADMISA